MKIAIHGTNGGYRQLYPEEKVAGLFDARYGGDEPPVGQEAYSIHFSENSVIFSKYKIIRDIISTTSRRTGNIAFCIIVPYTEKLLGEDVKDLLDKLTKEFYEKHLKESGNLEEFRWEDRDWEFVRNAEQEYNENKIKPINNPISIQQGTYEAAFVYYSDDELLKYFDAAPYQKEYSSYKQVFFVDKKFDENEKNPLNVLEHSKENNLTKKITIALSHRLGRFQIMNTSPYNSIVENETGLTTYESIPSPEVPPKESPLSLDNNSHPKDDHTTNELTKEVADEETANPIKSEKIFPLKRKKEHRRDEHIGTSKIKSWHIIIGVIISICLVMLLSVSKENQFFNLLKKNENQKQITNITDSVDVLINKWYDLSERTIQYVNSDSLILHQLKEYYDLLQSHKKELEHFKNRLSKLMIGDVDTSKEVRGLLENINNTNDLLNRVNGVKRRRESVDKKQFTEFKGGTISLNHWRELQNVVLSIDSADYEKIMEELGDISSLTLTQIADSLNVLSNIHQRQIQGEGSARSETNRSVPEPIIREYLQGCVLDSNKLKEYHRSAPPTLKPSIQVCLNFLRMRGDNKKDRLIIGNKKHRDTYQSLFDAINNVPELNDLKNSKLYSFLKRMITDRRELSVIYSDKVKEELRYECQ